MANLASSNYLDFQVSRDVGGISHWAAKLPTPSDSEKFERAGTVDFKKHPARKVGTRCRQCRPKVPGRFAFPGARNPRIESISLEK